MWIIGGIIIKNCPKSYLPGHNVISNSERDSFCVVQVSGPPGYGKVDMESVNRGSSRKKTCQRIIKLIF